MPKLVQVAHQLSSHRGAVLITAPTGASLPQPLQRLCTTLRLAPPSPRAVLRLRARAAARSAHGACRSRSSSAREEVARLISHLQGLTLFEVKKILTKVAVEDGMLNADDIPRIADAKKEIVERSGVLEYFAAEERMAEVAGLGNLKAWLAKRKPAFTEPERAKQFGLSPPRGILLIGVQGCGKSMCAKAIAREWELPLIRLDPSNLYNKYFGESEKNLKRATRTAETMAPIVLWIDEMEKAFAQGGQDDSGTTHARVRQLPDLDAGEEGLGVFVVATSQRHLAPAAGARAQGPLRRDLLRRPAEPRRARSDPRRAPAQRGRDARALRPRRARRAHGGLQRRRDRAGGAVGAVLGVRAARRSCQTSTSPTRSRAPCRCRPRWPSRSRALRAMGAAARGTRGVAPTGSVAARPVRSEVAGAARPTRQRPGGLHGSRAGRLGRASTLRAAGADPMRAARAPGRAS